MTGMICTWCGKNADEARARYEGPHSTWCVHYRRDQVFQRAMDAKYRPLPLTLAEIADLGEEPPTTT